MRSNPERVRLTLEGEVLVNPFILRVTVGIMAMEMFSSFWLWQFLGRLHPLLVHFPIALLVVGLFLEALTLGGKRPTLRDGIAWMLRIGAASAVAAAGAGWLLSTQDGVTGDLVRYHQWLGLATAILAVGAVTLHEVALRKEGAWLTIYRSVLTLSVGALIVTGHLGASLTHGSDYLASTLPWNQVVRPSDDEAAAFLAEYDRLRTASAVQEVDRQRLTIQVRQTFAHTCYKCHSADKQEGGLRLDSKEAVMKGGDGGRILVPGDAAGSEIVRRINLPHGHEDVMPNEGALLSDEQIALIELWIDEGAPWPDVDFQVFPEAPLDLTMPALPEGPGDHPIDRFVHAYFAEQDRAWPDPVDDATFVRRAHLDLIGLLPAPEAVDAFVADPAPDKRTHLVDSLLARDESYAQHWLTFWNDLLRNDYTGTGFITGGREQITGWLYDALRTNEPYDAMVRALISPSDSTEGFIKGIRWRGAVNASQTTEMQAAQNVSQALLGVNLKCASCHDSFVSNWTLDQAYGFAQIFADSALQLVRCDEPTGRMASARFLYPELGRIDGTLPVAARLEQLADLMVTPENGRLYRTIANRLWAQLMGRGIVGAVDEMDSPPWSQDLLDWLAADLVQHGYDLKRTLRLIATSRAYSLPSVGLAGADALQADAFRFEGPLRRRLTAEQFVDALSQAIAPVYTAVAFDPYHRTTPAEWIWYPAMKNDRAILPEPGPSYFRHRFAARAAPAADAEVIVTADDAYRLYLNGRFIGDGAGWHTVGRYDVTEILEPGPNVIAVRGENGGALENPAGLLLSLTIRYADGSDQMVTTFGGGRRDTDGGVWLSTDTAVPEGWQAPAYDDAHWQPVRRMGRYDDNPYWGRLPAFTHDPANQDVPFARASLTELDAFQKVLGRPDREIITTSRADQTTLLQALELTNGAFLSDWLQQAARAWYARYEGDPRAITHNLYRAAFGRAPSPAEAAAAVDALGPDPNPARVEDLIWALVLTPEFQLIY